jgi:hypothetical protein
MFASRGLRFTSDDISLAHCRHHATGRIRRETVYDDSGQVLSSVDFPDHGFMWWYCDTILLNPACRWSYYRLSHEKESYRLEVDLMPCPPEGWQSDPHIGACMYEMTDQSGGYVPASDFMLDSNPLVFNDLRNLFYNRNSIRFSRYRTGEYTDVVNGYDMELSSRVRKYHLRVLESTGKPARLDLVPADLFTGFPQSYLDGLRQDGRIVLGKCGKP